MEKSSTESFFFTKQKVIASICIWFYLYQIRDKIFSVTTMNKLQLKINKEEINDKFRTYCVTIF